MFDSSNKDRQAEFFNGLSDISKKPMKRKFNLGKIAVSLSYENILVLSIGLIMLLIVCYSLGVERGKYLAQLTPLQAEESEDIAVEPEQAQTAPKEPAPRPPFKSSAYIQVASFRTDKYAKEEIEELKSKGYRPFVSIWGNYRVVCVGGYKNKGEATTDLEQLKKDYADCILRSK